MEITNIQIDLVPDVDNRLCAFAKATLDDCLVIHDIKVINGFKGMFIAMPNRKTTDRCSRCSRKNELRARFCNNCGTRLAEGREFDQKVYHDIVHPITNEFRDVLEKAILSEYKRNKEAFDNGLVAGTDPVEYPRPPRLSDIEARHE